MMADFDDGGARKLEATMPASYTGVQSEGTAAPVALDSMRELECLMIVVIPDVSIQRLDILLLSVPFYQASPSTRSSGKV